MLPFRSSRGRNVALRAFITLAISGVVVMAAEQSPSPAKKERHGGSLTKIPLPVGQEAKGLVLPDIDTEGHLRARFEAGAAKRLRLSAVWFQGPEDDHIYPAEHARSDDRDAVLDPEPGDAGA